MLGTEPDVARTSGALWHFPVMLLLARVEGGSFVDLVDGWLAWHGGAVKRSELGAQLPAFIQHYCEHRHADAHFFLMGAAAERREAPPPAAEVPARG